MALHNKNKQTPVVFDGHLTDTLKISNDFTVVFDKDTAIIKPKSFNVINWLEGSPFRYKLTFTSTEIDETEICYDLTNIYMDTDLQTYIDIYVCDSNGNLLSTYIDSINSKLYVKYKRVFGENELYIYFGSGISNIGDSTIVTSQLLPYCILNGELWVKCDLTDDYVVHVTNTDTVASNGDEVFIFYDDFKNDTIGTKWSIASGNWSIASDHLNVDVGEANAIINANCGQIENATIGMRSKLTLNTSDCDSWIGALFYEQTLGGSTGYCAEYGRLISGTFRLNIEKFTLAHLNGFDISYTEDTYKDITVDIHPGDLELSDESITAISADTTYINGYIGIRAINVVGQIDHFYVRKSIAFTPNINKSIVGNTLTYNIDTSGNTAEAYQIKFDASELIIDDTTLLKVTTIGDITVLATNMIMEKQLRGDFM